MWMHWPGGMLHRLLPSTQTKHTHTHTRAEVICCKAPLEDSVDGLNLSMEYLRHHSVYTLHVYTSINVWTSLFALIRYVQSMCYLNKIH